MTGAAAVPSGQRVLVIGCSGAGKTTFATRLAALTGLPLIHLDREFWQPGWRMPEGARWQEKVRSLVAGERWIIEGTFTSTLDLRLPRADAVVWFDFPRGRCLWRAFMRAARSYGRARPDMAPGCPSVSTRASTTTSGPSTTCTGRGLPHRSRRTARTWYLASCAAMLTRAAQLLARAEPGAHA